jgi:UDP-N-acetylglucosamine 2-epimerase (hydrolysing)
MKKILFLTGTRADYGKIKSLITTAHNNEFDCRIFATGMHTLEKYGYTLEEIRNDGFDNIYAYNNQIIGEPMDLVLANTIFGLSRYIHESPPDLIIIHGDRIEALAGAIVGSLRNILTAHIEGGELSGTIDEVIRHSVSKLCHLHFVSNENASQRLMQMGERKESIHIIGSPDIDIMISKNLPSISEVKKRYEIKFERFAISIFHPVTTEFEKLQEYTKNYFNALLESGLNYILIYPNNDEGTSIILNEMNMLRDNPRCRLLPSMRFEWFLTLLQNTDFIIGNSSAAIREAPVYGTLAVNVGTRQNNRIQEAPSIINCSYHKNDILRAIQKVSNMERQPPNHYFGSGDSCQKFITVLKNDSFWATSLQKNFVDI